MRKKYFLYQGKYSNTYRVATAEDLPTVAALLSEGWTRTTIAEVRSLCKRGRGYVTDTAATAYIDGDGALVVVNPD